MADSSDTDRDTEAQASIALQYHKTDLNIHERLFACMREAPTLEKDQFVQIRGEDAYGYISHDNVTAAVRPLFCKYGVMVLPTVVKTEKDGNRLEVTVDISFINVEKPDDRITMTVIGHGCGNDDKNPGKALSYATKYAYMKVLMLNSGDDIGGETITHDPEVPRQTAVDVADEKRIKAQHAAANSLKLAIEGAATVQELRKLKRDHAQFIEDVPGVTKNYFNDIFNQREEEIFDGVDSETGTGDDVREHGEDGGQSA